MYFKYVEIGKAVNIRQPSTSSNTLWSARDAKANGEEHYDQGSGRQLESRAAVRQAMGGKTPFKMLGVSSRSGFEEDRGRRRLGRVLDRKRKRHVEQASEPSRVFLSVR